MARPGVIAIALEGPHRAVGHGQIRDRELRAVTQRPRIELRQAAGLAQHAKIADAAAFLIDGGVGDAAGGGAGNRCISHVRSLISLSVDPGLAEPLSPT